MTRNVRALQALCLTLTIAASGCNGGNGRTGRNGGATARGQGRAAARVLNNNGVMLLEHQAGDALGALSLFRRAVETDPDYAIGWVNLGIAQFAQSQPDYDQVIQSLDRAEKLGADLPNLYFTRGLARYHLPDYPAAQTDFEKVARADPGDAFTRYHLGMALKAQEKYADAVKELEKALARLPNFQSAWMNAGQCYQRLNRPRDAERAIERTRALQDAGTGITASRTGYFAGLGRYAEPVPDTSAPNRVAGGPMVTFADATTATLPELKSYQWKGGDEPTFGASWGDLNNDSRPDLILCRSANIEVFHNDGGMLQPNSGSGLVYPKGGARGAAWGDLDNDGNEDVILYGTAGARRFANNGSGRFKPLEALSGRLSHATCVDYDHDGFLDLLVVRENGTLGLYVNRGGATLSDVTAKSGLVNVKGATYALPTDFDRDRAVDILLADSDGTPKALRNNYNGIFSPVKNAAGLAGLGRCRQIAAADFNSDGRIDYAAATDRGVQIALQQADGTFKSQAVTGSDRAEIVLSATIADFDNDGNHDILALCIDPAGMGGNTLLSLYQGNGDGTFVDATEASGLKGVTSRSRERLALADVDGNGGCDILQAGAKPRLLKNGGNANRWVRLNLRGLEASPNRQWRKGPKTNGSGLGVLVEAWTESTWAMTEVTGAAGDDRQPIFGLGSTSAPRWVRILWTSGVHECEPIGDQKGAGPAGIDYRQLEGRNERGEITRATHMYTSIGGGEQFLGQFGRGASMTELPGPLNATWSLWEPNRDPTSCPVLYTWDGKRYRFVTDLQGGAIIGYNVGEYQYAPNDPDEYVMLPEGSLALKDGQYDVEIANQLQEILYIDGVHLLAVDHPASTRVYSNDRMQAAPPYPAFAPWSVDEVRPPRTVIGNRGQDVAGLVSSIDRRYPEDFDKLKFDGFTERHTLTVDLGDTRGAKKVYLLLYGWQRYAHSSSNLAASRAGIYGEPPSLQVRDANGRWKTVIPDMGAVAGLPKWLAVDVTPFVGREERGERRKAKVDGNLSPLASRLSPQLRILTNLQLYWDKIEVGLLRGEAPTIVTRLTPSSANYHWLGYPKPQFPDGREPVVYDYDQRRDTAPWWTPAGFYTRTGDVTELLQKPDDRYVIMRHGHAMNIRFDPAKLPPLPAGWKRDFVLMSDGFGKDMDMNGATALTVEPLPFHKMTRYPYGKNEHYPDTPEHRAYREKYNTVFEPGTRRVAHWPEVRLEEK